MGRTIEARCRLAILALIVIALPIISIVAPVYADTSGAVTIKTPVGLGDGIGFPQMKNSFYTAGRHWVVYLNDATDLVYTSSTTGTAGTWTEQTIVANTTLLDWELSFFFDNTTSKLHYVRNASDGSQTLYGMGTPSSIGTIAWSAEDVVYNSNSTGVVSICTDVDGYPWVAWTNEEVLSPDFVLYIKSSSTKDGTWTDAVFNNITIAADRTLGYTQITPVQSGVYPRVEVDYIYENDTTHGVSLVASNSLDNFTAQYTIVPEGGVVSAGYSFSLNNMDAAGMICVYANTTGALYAIGRGAGNWTTAPAATEILPAAAGNGTWSPTVSTYNAVPGGYDIICVATNDHQVAYSIRPFGGSWGAWTYIWSTPGTGVILRHSASYDGDVTGGMPFGFTWQDDTLGTGVSGSVYYWWFSEDGLGYYPSTSTGTSFPMNDVVRFLLGAIFLTCMVMGLLLIVLATPIKYNIMALMITFIMVVLCMIIGMAVINTLV